MCIHMYLQYFLIQVRVGVLLPTKMGIWGGGDRKICYDYFGCMINLYMMCLNGSSLGM